MPADASCRCATGITGYGHGLHACVEVWNALRPQALRYMSETAADAFLHGICACARDDTGRSLLTPEHIAAELRLPSNAHYVPAEKVDDCALALSCAVPSPNGRAWTRRDRGPCDDCNCALEDVTSQRCTNPLMNPGGRR